MRVAYRMRSLAQAASTECSAAQECPGSQEDELFDYRRKFIHLAEANCSPEPLREPTPPIMIGGRSSALLRMVAAHADLWNIPGGGELKIGWPQCVLAR